MNILHHPAVTLDTVLCMRQKLTIFTLRPKEARITTAGVVPDGLNTLAILTAGRRLTRCCIGDRMALKSSHSYGCFFTGPQKCDPNWSTNGQEWDPHTHIPLWSLLPLSPPPPYFAPPLYSRHACAKGQGQGQPRATLLNNECEIVNSLISVCFHPQSSKNLKASFLCLQSKS